MYDKLSGMTGTAQTEAAELNGIYKVDVVPIPTNRPMIRKDQPDLVYKTEVAKYEAVVEDIVARHEKGQPVLVGTVSVEKSEYLSEQLRRRGVRHEVLNAKHHEREAAIVAEAGRKGAVTVATNMAGRGTDIMLGGNPEFRAVAALRAKGLDPEETPEEYEAAWDDALAQAEKDVAAEHDEVKDLGGLYVLGTERHESRRIDNQLRGRSGRQGDPGESRFYLSLGDHLMRLFNAGMVERVMNTAGLPDDQPIESKMVSRSIQSAQTQVEAQNYEIRKNVLKYDDVLNRQRTVIYAERRRVLEGEDLHEQLRYFVNDVVEGYVDGATGQGFAEDWNLDQLWTALKALYPVSLTQEQVLAAAGGRSGLSPESLKEEFLTDAHNAYDAREAALGAEVMREVERRVMLSVLDRKWREHLYEMDYLKEGIGLRAMAQRDPLVEYQREGFLLWQAMNESVKEEAVGLLFHVDVQVNPGQSEAAAAPQPMHVSQMLKGMPAAASASDSTEAIAPADEAVAGAAAGGEAAHDGGAVEEERPQVAVSGVGIEAPRARNLHYSAPSETGGTEERDERAGSSARETQLTRAQLNGTPKNAPCPCGSGKKFKMCHGRRDS
jgi:preprotein translocase subunit SecA